MIEPCLYDVCQHVDFTTSDVEEIREAGHMYIRSMTDSRNLKLLARAEKALTNGYYEFLRDLNRTYYFLVMNAQDTAHVTNLTNREIADSSRKIHKEAMQNATPEERKRALEKIEYFNGINITPNTHRFGRSIAETDFPTKTALMAVFESVYPEHSKYIPGKEWGKTRSDTSVSKMWKDAGLSHVRKGSKSFIHPNILRSREILRERKT